MQALLRISRNGLAALVLATSSGHAAEHVVQLGAASPIRPGLEALPTIVDPSDEAERRINASLRRLNANVLRAVAICRSYDGRPGRWRRRVDIPMRGPRYLSVVTTDHSFCDGAHPSRSVMASVYDLRTGTPVDWTALLPATLAGTVTLLRGGDGTEVVTLASRQLHALYLAGYRVPAAVADDDCRQAVTEAGASAPPAMMAWLDARQGGLAVQFGLPNLVEACVAPVVIPSATLRGAGAGALANALDAARQAQ